MIRLIARMFYDDSRTEELIYTVTRVSGRLHRELNEEQST